MVSQGELYLSLRKHAYSNILRISPPKTENFQVKNSDIFHISAQNIDCGYSLEPPRRGPSKHVYMGPIWAESGHLSHSGPAWAPYRLFCPYKTYIGPILVNFDQQTHKYGNHMGRFRAFIPFGSYLGPI